MEKIKDMNIQAMLEQANVAVGVLNIVDRLQERGYTKEAAAQDLLNLLDSLGFLAEIKVYKVNEQQKSPTSRV